MTAAASGARQAELAVRRDPGIDALRGAAILMVILQHAAIRLPLERSAAAVALPARLRTGGGSSTATRRCSCSS